MTRKKDLPINESPLIAYMEEAYTLSVALAEGGNLSESGKN